MSQENVEVVKRGWAAWIKGDLDAVLEVFDPAVEWHTTNLEGWPEDAVYYGRNGVRRFFEEWLASWERYEAGVEQYLDAGGDRVLVLCWQTGYGVGSAVPVRMDWAQVIHAATSARLPSGGLLRPAGSPRSRGAAGAGGTRFWKTVPPS